jgi:hypothetical protein
VAAFVVHPLHIGPPAFADQHLCPKTLYVCTPQQLGTQRKNELWRPAPFTLDGVSPMQFEEQEQLAECAVHETGSSLLASKSRKSFARFGESEIRCQQKTQCSAGLRAIVHGCPIAKHALIMNH